MPHQILASRLVSLLEVLYLIVIDVRDNPEAKASSDMAAQIRALAQPAVKEWGDSLPNLRLALRAAISGNDKIQACVNLGNDIKDSYQEFRLNSEFRTNELDVLRALGLYLRTDSEAAWKTLTRYAGLTDSSYVAEKMDAGHGEQDDARLRQIVKKFGGQGNSMDLELAKKAKVKNEELYKEYLALRREYNQVWKDAIISFIRQSGQKLVPFKDAEAYLKSIGVQHALPHGFTGLVDDQIHFYTKDGKAIDGVPSAVTFPVIVMNKTYGKPNGGDWVFRADKESGETGPYFYTKDFKRTRAKEKFKKVEALMDKLPRIRDKWFKKVRRFDPSDVDCVASVILETLYEFSARIGSVGNEADGKPTFGVCTLLVKHAKIQANHDVVLSYKGKDGVNTRHVIKANDPEMKFLASDIAQLMENKGPNDRLFTVDKGSRVAAITPTVVNNYFRSLGAGEVTVHKIRTYWGTKIMKDLIEEQQAKTARSQPKTEKEAMTLLTKMAEQVGKKLNHVKRTGDVQKVTGTTALANYVDPLIQVEFFSNLGFRPPKYLEKFAD